MQIQVKNPEQVVREIFWLAWQACGGPGKGLGFLSDNPGATRGDVWRCVYDKADYPGGNKIDVEEFRNKPGRVYGDWVFGRMMKLGVEWDETSITVSDQPPDPRYQDWAQKYPTKEDLVHAAIKNVES